MTEKEELLCLKERNKELLNIIADLSLRIECIKADVKKIQTLINSAFTKKCSVCNGLGLLKGEDVCGNCEGIGRIV